MKKKGLIISTIVMVVVLIASLTTATYAWFASNATVSVSDMTLTTKAADGLEISVLGDSKNWSGALSLNEQTYNSYVKGATEDWGTELSFESPGESPHATTHLTWAEAADATEANYKNGTYFVRTGSEEPYTFTRGDQDGIVFSGTTFYKATADSTNATDNMYRPTGYDDNQEPTGYEHAINLTNYFYLPIRIRPTMQVRQIFYRVLISPQMNAVKTDFYPGMAAASRLVISGADSKTATPFNAAHISGSAMLNGSEVKYAGTETYSWDGFILNNATAQAAYSEYEFNLQLWVEGEDPQCVNKTAGSGFTVQIVFGYVGATGEMVTLTDGVCSATFKNAAGETVPVGTVHA